MKSRKEKDASIPSDPRIEDKGRTNSEKFCWINIKNVCNNKTDMWHFWPHRNRIDYSRPQTLWRRGRFKAEGSTTEVTRLCKLHQNWCQFRILYWGVSVSWDSSLSFRGKDFLGLNSKTEVSGSGTAHRFFSCEWELEAKSRCLQTSGGNIHSQLLMFSVQDKRSRGRHQSVWHS